MIPRTIRQLAPIRASLAARTIAPAPALTQRTWTRNSSSTKPLSPQTQFYKTFGRPIAKVFMLAIFTYQLAYFYWAYMECDEVKRETQGEETLSQTRPDYFFEEHRNGVLAGGKS